MLNNKYSKALTIILIIAILIIVGLLAYVAIDWYKTSNTKKDTDDFFEQFNGYIENIPENEENNATTNIDQVGNVDLNNIIDEGIINEPINSENNNNGSTSSNNGMNLNGMSVAGTIEIPKTNVKEAILNDSSSKALDSGIAILYGPGVNMVGNTVLAGHNYRNGTFFSNNKKLSEGDKIYITDMSGKKVTYVIYKKYKTDANDFSYATRETNGKREISLTTCTDDSSARIIIWAKEQ